MPSPEQRIRELVSQIGNLPPSAIHPTADLKLDLGIDSLTVLQIVAAIEEEYRITIPDAELGRLRTIEEMVDRIRRPTSLSSCQEVQ